MNDVGISSDLIEQIESGEYVMLDLSKYETRVALRAYAYTVIALGDKALGDAILDRVGKER